MTDYLVCMCACVHHGIHAHSIIESIPDGIRLCCGLLYSGYGKLKPRAAQRVLNKTSKLENYKGLGTTEKEKKPETQTGR